MTVEPEQLGENASEGTTTGAIMVDVGFDFPRDHPTNRAIYYSASNRRGKKFHDQLSSREE